MSDFDELDALLEESMKTVKVKAKAKKGKTLSEDEMAALTEANYYDRILAWDDVGVIYHQIECICTNCLQTTLIAGEVYRLSKHKHNGTTHLESISPTDESVELLELRRFTTERSVPICMECGPAGLCKVTSPEEFPILSSLGKQAGGDKIKTSDFYDDEIVEEVDDVEDVEDYFDAEAAGGFE